MKIQVLGTGCAKCRQLEERTRKAVATLGVDADVEKVADIMQIAAFKVMFTPALAVDGKVLFSGKVPSEKELERILSAAVSA